MATRLLKIAFVTCLLSSILIQELKPVLAKTGERLQQRTTIKETILEELNRMEKDQKLMEKRIVVLKEKIKTLEGCKGGCQFWYDSAAFLFSLVNKPGWQPLKLDQTGQFSSHRAYSIYSCSSHGPTFGFGYDIYIADHASSNTDSGTILGETYGPPPGYSYGSSDTRSFLAGDLFFRPDEVEVFFETT